MQLEYVCNLCGEKFPSPRRLGWHLRMVHDMSVEEYYTKCLQKNPNEGKCLLCGKKTNFESMTRGFRDFCGVSCARKYAEKNIDESDAKTVKCKCCDEEIHGKSERDAGLRLGTHVWYVHQMTSQEYYDRYEKKPGEDVCASCGKTTRYIGVLSGYERYCGPCAALVNGGGKLGKAEIDAKKHKEDVLKEQKRIQDYYKKLYADDDVTDPKERPHNVAKGMGLLTNDVIGKENDKFYTEIDTCEYELPVEHEVVEHKIKRRYKDSNTEENPGWFQWIINKLR